MTSISDVVRQFKQRWTQTLDAEVIEGACREAAHTWRQCLLNPVFTVRLFLLQILWGNTACDHVARLGGGVFTGEAYCKARAKLPLAVLRDIFRRTTQAMLQTAGDGHWHERRVWLLDGTGFSMSDHPDLRRHYGQPGGQKTGCGFPVAHALALMHEASGLVQRLITAPLRTHDLSLAWQLESALEPGDVLVADRAYSSYAHLAQLQARGVFGLMRAHQKLKIDFTARRPHVPPGKNRTKEQRGQAYSRWIKRLAHQDQLVEWFKPKSRPVWLSDADYAALPASLMVRELRYRTSQRGFRTREVTLVTTLLDAALYPQQELAQLYRRRWKIETNFAHLKQTLGMDVLKCQTVEGVEKEALMFVLVYNLVRMVMREAAARQSVEVERISFVDAVRWLLSARPDSTLPELCVIPLRPRRHEPRVRKRRPKQYPLMKRPRTQLRQALQKQALTP